MSKKVYRSDREFWQAMKEYVSSLPHGVEVEREPLIDLNKRDPVSLDVKRQEIFERANQLYRA